MKGESQLSLIFVLLSVVENLNDGLYNARSFSVFRRRIYQWYESL